MAAVLLVGFVVIELRARHALLPLRILGLATPRAANIVGFLDRRRAVLAVLPALALHAAGAGLLGAEDRRRLHRDDVPQSCVFAVVAQALVNRIGTRVVLPIGLRAHQRSPLLLYTRLPVNGSYVANLLPGFLLAGIGLGLAFVPDSIAALTGARAREAGAASGLINTSQQIGGAVGLAAITTIATTATTNYLRSSRASLGALAAGGRPDARLPGRPSTCWPACCWPRPSLAAVLIRPEAAAAAEPAPCRAPAGRAGGRAPSRRAGRSRSACSGWCRRAWPARDRGSYHAQPLPGRAGTGAGGHDDRRVRHRRPADLPRRRRARSATRSRRRSPGCAAALRQSEAMLVATPQYDSGVGGALRNAFAWAQRGRRRPAHLAGKPLAVMGPSCDERDMREAQAQMREALGDGHAPTATAAFR